MLVTVFFKRVLELIVSDILALQLLVSLSVREGVLDNQQISGKLKMILLFAKKSKQTRNVD